MRNSISTLPPSSGHVVFTSSMMLQRFIFPHPANPRSRERERGTIKQDNQYRLSIGAWHINPWFPCVFYYRPLTFALAILPEDRNKRKVPTTKALQPSAQVMASALSLIRPFSDRKSPIRQHGSGLPSSAMWQNPRDHLEVVPPFHPWSACAQSCLLTRGRHLVSWRDRSVLHLGQTCHSLSPEPPRKMITLTD